VSDTLVAQFGLPASAAVILDVGPKGPGAVAGLRPNDVLLAINGKQYTDFEALGNALSNQTPGQEVALTIMRAGEKREVKVTPVER
jgi:serine protease Do